ncbi:MAG: DUF4860 domain-containing protein [Anaerobutyricum soehngenii]
MKQNYTVRTAAAYVQEKIREYSSSSQVEVLTENNRTVLALYEPENTGYVTYIYLYKGKLRELLQKRAGNRMGKWTGISERRYIFCHKTKGGSAPDPS